MQTDFFTAKHATDFHKLAAIIRDRNPLLNSAESPSYTLCDFVFLHFFDVLGEFFKHIWRISNSLEGCIDTFMLNAILTNPDTTKITSYDKDLEKVMTELNEIPGYITFKKSTKDKENQAKCLAKHISWYIWRAMHDNEKNNQVRDDIPRTPHTQSNIQFLEQGKKEITQILQRYKDNDYYNLGKRLKTDVEDIKNQQRGDNFTGTLQKASKVADQLLELSACAIVVCSCYGGYYGIHHAKNRQQKDNYYYRHLRFCKEPGEEEGPQQKGSKHSSDSTTTKEGPSLKRMRH